MLRGILILRLKIKLRSNQREEMNAECGIEDQKLFSSPFRIPRSSSLLSGNIGRIYA
jgi:hypothetical protein